MARFVKYYDLSGHWLSKKPEYSSWWMDLVYLANYEDSRFFINGVMVECKRGELAWSVLSLSERWKVDRQRVRTFLKSLEKDFMITLKSNQQTTVITICNYCKYQDNKPTDKPTPNQRLTNGKPTPNHIIEIQEVLEVLEVLEKDISANADSAKPKKQSVEKLLLLDYGVDEQLADDFIVLRKSKRSPVTKTVCRSIMAEAEKAMLSFNQAIEICIARGWQGFNASWDLGVNKPINEKYKTKEQLRQEGTDRAREEFLNRNKTIDGELSK